VIRTLSGGIMSAAFFTSISIEKKTFEKIYAKSIYGTSKFDTDSKNVILLHVKTNLLALQQDENQTE